MECLYCGKEQRTLSFLSRWVVQLGYGMKLWNVIKYKEYLCNKCLKKR